MTHRFIVYPSFRVLNGVFFFCFHQRIIHLLSSLVSVYTRIEWREVS